MMRYSVISAIVLALLVGSTVYLLRSPAKSGGAPATTLTITEDPQTAPGFPTAEESMPNDTTNTSPVAPPRTPPAGALEYRDTHYRFSLFYPQDLKATAYDEGGGAATIVFENDASAKGFQIFITPYGARQVSLERFKKDEPSGVMQEPQDIQIDGVVATMFFSKDQLLGDTREVWFIHGGYLFEVTAPKTLDAFLAEVMTTWKFI